MNIAFPRRNEAGRRPPFLAAILAGTALGVLSAVGIWQAVDSSSGAKPVSVARSLPGMEFFARDSRSLVLYLVDTPEDADMVSNGEEEAARERDAGGVPDPGYVVQIINMTAPYAEDALREVLDAWSTSPGGVRLVDYRSR